MKVSLFCPECLARLPLPDPREAPSGEAACEMGHSPIPFAHSEAVQANARVDRCSQCASASFFAEKDFDQRLGCLVLAAGAGLALLAGKLWGGVFFAPVLLAVAALDFLLFRRIGTVVICYRCDAEYRGAPDAASVRPYDPHVAERHAEVKTVRRMNP